jgi:tRNA-splicing ligase RtcB
MVSKADFVKIHDYLYEIPKSFRADMRVPARVYADARLLQEAIRDKSFTQLVNTTTLPGLVKYSIVMPDVHQGYGFPIGGVAATKLPDGVISPGGVGYDINCGVRLVASHLDSEEVAPHIEDLITAIYRNCPSGVGKGGSSISVRAKELDEILASGARWAKKRGYASDEDLERTEEGGAMAEANPTAVSKKAKDRGRTQVGTLGGGNHFIEVDEVVEIYDAEAADAFGLFPGQVTVQIHCGSRGLGHQVCTDYVSRLQKAVHKYGIKLADRELVCAPLSSPEGKDYLAAMACSANYAWANRQVLFHHVRRSFEEVLAGKVKNWHLYQVYDVAHNIAKIEEHEVDGRMMTLCVHRKGATRAFGPDRPEVPAAYRQVGQPVLVPGSMGTASYVLVGTEKSMHEAFGSSCHGAGRVMSRTRARKGARGEEVRRELEGEGIAVRAGSMRGLAEEAPRAYKDVSRVVEVVDGAGIARKVARLEPLAVIKG